MSIAQHHFVWKSIILINADNWSLIIPDPKVKSCPVVSIREETWASSLSPVHTGSVPQSSGTPICGELIWYNMKKKDESWKSREIPQRCSGAWYSGAQWFANLWPRSCTCSSSASLRPCWPMIQPFQHLPGDHWNKLMTILPTLSPQILRSSPIAFNKIPIRQLHLGIVSGLGVAVLTSVFTPVSGGQVIILEVLLIDIYPCVRGSSNYFRSALQIYQFLFKVPCKCHTLHVSMNVLIWQQHLIFFKNDDIFRTFAPNFQLSPATCLASTLLHRISPVKVNFQDVLVNILQTDIGWSPLWRPVSTVVVVMTNVMNLDDLRFPLKAAAMVAGQCGGAVLAAGTKSIF